MNYRSYNKLRSFDLKNIIELLRSNKLDHVDIENNLKEIIDHYHLKTLRTKMCYNLFDFVHDLYKLGEYDLINNIIQIDHQFSSRDNIYDSLLAFEIYKDETTQI